MANAAIRWSFRIRGENIALWSGDNDENLDGDTFRGGVSLVVEQATASVDANPTAVVSLSVVVPSIRRALTAAGGLLAEIAWWWQDAPDTDWVPVRNVLVGRVGQWSVVDGRWTGRIEAEHPTQQVNSLRWNHEDQQVRDPTDQSMSRVRHLQEHGLDVSDWLTTTEAPVSPGPGTPPGGGDDDEGGDDDGEDDGGKG